MLRSVLFALLSAASLFAFGVLDAAPFGAACRAIAAVAMGVAVTSLAFGELHWLTVAAGALSPLVFSAMTPRSLGVATALLCCSWLAPRALLARTRPSLIAHLSLSVCAAGVAGTVFASYLDDPLLSRLASCAFAGSCLSLVVVLVPVDTSTGLALRSAASAIGSNVAASLLRAAEGHHRAARFSALKAPTEWRSLVRLANERALLERLDDAVTTDRRHELDERIEALVATLVPARAPQPGAPTAEVEVTVCP